MEETWGAPLTPDIWGATGGALVRDLWGLFWGLFRDYLGIKGLKVYSSLEGVYRGIRFRAPPYAPYG